VLKTKTLAQEDLNKLAPLQKDPTFNFWVFPSVGRSAEIMVPAENVTGLMGKLRRYGLEPTIFIDNVGT